jgi:hypothetical protein
MSSSSVDADIELDGRTFRVSVVTARAPWVAIVFDDIIVVNDTGDEELNLVLARSALAGEANRVTV